MFYILHNYIIYVHIQINLRFVLLQSSTPAVGTSTPAGGLVRGYSVHHGVCDHRCLMHCKGPCTEPPTSTCTPTISACTPADSSRYQLFMHICSCLLHLFASLLLHILWKWSLIFALWGFKYLMGSCIQSQGCTWSCVCFLACPFVSSLVSSYWFLHIFVWNVNKIHCLSSHVAHTFFLQDFVLCGCKFLVLSGFVSLILHNYLHIC